jgi:hypothetical protein
MVIMTQMKRVTPVVLTQHPRAWNNSNNNNTTTTTQQLL